MANKIEATITVSGWGENNEHAVEDLARHLRALAEVLESKALDPLNYGLRFDEFDERADYAGMCGECRKCQYVEQQEGIDFPYSCCWNPATDPTGCEIENKKEVK